MRNNFLILVVCVFTFFACGESGNTSPTVDTDMGGALDQAMASVGDTDVMLDVTFADATTDHGDAGQTLNPDAEMPRMPDCTPALSIESTTNAARPNDLVRLSPRGGSGYWRFELVASPSGGSINAETGVYLAGPTDGVTDIIRLTDEECIGEFLFEIEVVLPLLTQPTQAIVMPRETFQFESTGGSGRVHFELLNDSSSVLTPTGLYTAGPGLGVDLISVTDLGTGQIQSMRIDIVRDSRLNLHVPLYGLVEGASFHPEVSGGSGEFRLSSSSGSITVVEQSTLLATRPGRATITVSDRFLNRTAQFDVYVPQALRAETLISSDGTRSTQMRSVGDLNGDGHTDVVVARSEADVNAGNGGAVYVFLTNDDGTFSSAPSQVIASAVRDDQSGFSFAVGEFSGDGIIDLAIGSRLGDFGASNSGGAQIFAGIDPSVRETTQSDVFEPEPRLTLPGINGFDFLGASMTACDFNGDGREDLAVGAPLFEDRLEEPVANNQGGVFVYFGGDAGITQEPVILTGKVLAGDIFEPTSGLHIGEFATSLTSGDYNGDGACDIAVGTIQYDGRMGMVSVYNGESSGVRGISDRPSRQFFEDRQQVDGIDMNATQLGRVLDSGDVNHDGVDDLLIGQLVGDVGGRDSGSMYLFFGGTHWDGLTPRTSTTDADWSFSGTAYDYLGWSLRIVDVNQDGIDDIVAGVIFDDFPSLGDAGALYAFFGSETTELSAEPYILYQGRDQGWQVGESFAIVDDVDGDGLSESMVYASRSQRLARDVGSVEWLPSTLNDEETLADTGAAFVLPDTVGGQRFGEGLNFVGDLDGDGFEDAVVVASMATHQDAGNRSGMAWIYFGNSTGLETIPVAIPAFNQWTGADFAWAASSVGDFDGDGRDDFALALRNDERANNLDDSIFDVGDECPGRLNDQGGVYIFAGGPRGTVGQQPAFVYWGPRAALLFENINAAGDVNGDGKTDILVGAIRSDINARDTGSIFMLT